MSRARASRARASVVDLFCGAGGLSYGFKSEGFALAAGIDIDETCRFPYATNNQAPFIRKDVGSLTAKGVEPLFEAGATRGLVGCAPCQPFSTYNQKNADPNWRPSATAPSLIERRPLKGTKRSDFKIRHIEPVRRVSAMQVTGVRSPPY